MKRLIPALALATLIAIVTAGSTVAASDASGSEPADPVYVDTAWVQTDPADPSQLQLRVSGQLPTPCHQPAWEVVHAEGRVDVFLWSTQDEGFCTAVLEPVEVTIPLGDDDPTLEVTLEGEPVERGAPTPETVTGLVGSGWSFGMCFGYCAADLRIDGDAVTLTAIDREEQEPLFVNHGQLTEEGQTWIAEELAAIQGVTLEPVYGCPDCADGGAAYILLAQAEGERRHEMEFGSPPEPLSVLYDVTMSISDALETCRSNELVTAAEDCTAYAPPTD